MKAPDRGASTGDGEALGVIADARNLIALAPKRILWVAARYVLWEFVANLASFVALFLMVPVLRSVGGERTSAVGYAFPWTPAGTDAFRLSWIAPFVAVLVATALLMLAKRREYEVMRVAAAEAEGRLADLLEARTAGRSVQRAIDGAAGATGMAMRWLASLANDALRASIAFAALVVFAPIAAPAAAAVAGVVMLALRVRREAPVGGGDASESGPRVEATIRKRLRMTDAVAVASVVTPFTLLLLLAAERAGVIAAFDVAELLFTSALVAAFARSMGGILHARILLAARPVKYRRLLAALTRGDRFGVIEAVRGAGRDGRGWHDESLEES